MAVTIETLLLKIQRTSGCGVLNTKSNNYTISEPENQEDQSKTVSSQGVLNEAAQDLYKGKPVSLLSWIGEGQNSHC